ncbi:Arm DNA-binding domain-containing protein [Paraburkholderia nodosa]|uniref:Arm DNA-binding domain-containing protein n=1 Tax=Paraburkholderia nodosa TaxID=392320 RepID=UPI002ADD5852|nr:Arm DNA-binding domain-containing protein [Paraburkholderia nodosa]
MAKVNFTAARVEAHRCEQGKSQSFLWDSKTPGLGLRATTGGAKAYIFQGKIHGSTVRITIGDPRSWTIDQAQERARSLQTLICQRRLETDPAGVRPKSWTTWEVVHVLIRRSHSSGPTLLEAGQAPRSHHQAIGLPNKEFSQSLASRIRTVP